MFARSKAVSLLLRAAIVVVLVSSVFAGKTPTLPTVHEDQPLPDRLSRPFQQQAGTRRGLQSVQLTGTVDSGLYPPRRPRTSFAGLRIASPQTVPLTGLLRGQQGNLVPIRLNFQLQLFPEPHGELASRVQPDSRDSTASTRNLRAPPSSNEEMERLLQTHSKMVSATFKAEAKPDPSRLTEKYHAVQLQGQGLDAKTLSKMQGKGLPFYVQGANNKVWFFDTKDSKKYTYTDEMESSDARFIREFFAQPSQDAVESWQAAARHGGSDAAGEAERLAGQTAVRQSSTSTGNSLVQKLAKGTRSFFGKALRP